jgi:putative transposase
VKRKPPECWWFQKALAKRRKISPLMYNRVGLPTKTIKTSKEDQVMKLDTDSLAHTQWNCKYHIVFAPKYRRQIIYGKIKSDIGTMLRKLCEYKGIEIIEAEACKDHIHMLVSIPPKYSVSQIMGYLKGKSSLMIFEKYANLKYKYGNRHFWCRGYYVDTVGRNKKAIEQYIRNQLQQDYEDDQLSIKEFVDPFTGEPVKEGK